MLTLILKHEMFFSKNSQDYFFLKIINYKLKTVFGVCK